MKENIFIKRPMAALAISSCDDWGDFARQPACRAISGHRAAYGNGASHLYGCRCRCSDEQCHYAAGGKHQQCGEHDVHQLYRHQLRHRHYQRLLQTGHRPRHGGSKRAEPRLHGTGAFACRSNPNRRANHQAPEQLPANQFAEEPRRTI